jgi:hypothetical protein
LAAETGKPLSRVYRWLLPSILATLTIPRTNRPTSPHPRLFFTVEYIIHPFDSIKTERSDRVFRPLLPHRPLFQRE